MAEREKNVPAMTASVNFFHLAWMPFWQRIKFCENVPGVSQPFNLRSHLGKVNTLKTLKMHFHFGLRCETDVLRDLLNIISF